MPYTSWDCYPDFVMIYHGDCTCLPRPIFMLCLEYAGLVGRGRKSCFFVVGKETEFK